MQLKCNQFFIGARWSKTICARCPSKGIQPLITGLYVNWVFEILLHIFQLYLKLTRSANLRGFKSSTFIFTSKPFHFVSLNMYTSKCVKSFEDMVYPCLIQRRVANLSLPLYSLTQ